MFFILCVQYFTVVYNILQHLKLVMIFYFQFYFYKQQQVLYNASANFAILSKDLYMNLFLHMAAQ